MKDGSGTTQSTLFSPTGTAFHAATGRLFVADGNNRRVLVFSGALATGMNAWRVIGQSVFTTRSSANSSGGLAFPLDVAYDASGSRLFVSDNSQHRVLVFSGGTVTNGMYATNVLGQSSFTTVSSATTQAGMRGPRGIEVDPSGSRLYVADSSNNRVTAYSISAIANGASATTTLGQTDDSLSDPQPVYTNLTANNGPNRLGFGQYPEGIAIDPTNHHLFVI
jgi:DNA-binding beta-propeller fold protein YncE